MVQQLNYQSDGQADSGLAGLTIPNAKDCSKPQIVTAGAPAMEVSLRDLSRRLQEFSTARNWDQFHSPRNLLLALVGEMGELSKIFQWRGEGDQRGLPGWSAGEKEHLGEELSDVLLYLLRLSDICEIDLGSAAIAKIWKNSIKYPAPPHADHKR